MARFLALDWDAGHVHLLAGSLGKSGVSLERALSWPEEQPPGPGTAEGFGQRLREHLREAGVSAAPLLIAVGRDRLILKEVRYPSVPPHEEPGVVRFQAVKELTDAADEVVIDYQAAEAPEPNGERKALAVALRRELLAAYQTLAKAAGVKLVAITPRAFGVMASLRRNANPPPDPGTAYAVLTVGERGGEFVVARSENLAFARALSGPALASDTALLGEIRRNLAVYAGQATQHPVRALYVAEAESLTLGVGDRIRDTLAIPVHRFDPLAGLDPPAGAAAGSFAGAAGLFHLYGRSRVLPVNFVKPREPKPPRDPNRRIYALAGALVALVVLGLGALGYGKLAAKDRILRERQEEKADLEAQLKAQEQNQRRIEVMDGWTNSHVNVLEELYNLTVHFPSLTQMQLTRLEAQPITTAVASNAPGKAVPVSRFATRFKLEGLKNETSSMHYELSGKLAQDTAHYRVPSPPGTKTPTNVGRGGGGGGGGGRLATQWELVYEAARRPPGDYKITLPADITVPERQQNNRRGGFGDINIFGFGGMLP